MKNTRLLITLASALAAGCLLNTARAGVSIAGTGVFGAANAATATDATALRVNRGGGSGHITVIPYFSSQSGNSTLINITNTDFNGKVVKVRFRSAVNADTVYDFTVLLGPLDVWSANISQGVNGLSTLTTTDSSYTLPANVNGSFVTNRLPSSGLTSAMQAELTREGYVEVITMADVPPGNDCATGVGRPTNHMYHALRRPVASCLDSMPNPTAADAAAISALANEPVTEQDALNLGLDTPTTGVFVNAILVNVFDASVVWTMPVTSITAVNAAGQTARGRIVFSPQTADAAPNIDLYTNDPLLRTIEGGGVAKIAPKQYDLPDLSTPYVGAAANLSSFPFSYVESVSEVLAAKKLKNEFLLETIIFARTDWTISLPTRRFAFGVDYSTSPISAVWNNGSAGASRYFSFGAGSIDGLKGCVNVFDDYTPGFVDRSMHQYNASPIFATPAMQNRPLCGAAPVLVFDPDPLAASVLRAKTTAVSIFPIGSNVESLPPSVKAGWAFLISEGTGMGMPLLGSAFIRARGPLVAGKSTNFGILYNHNLEK